MNALHPEIADHPGVYALYLNGVCVYVGKALKLRRRIREHGVSIAYDRVEVFECDPCNLSALEQAKITSLNPVINKAHTSKSKRRKAVRGISFRLATLSAAKARANETHGGNLSRYIDDLITKDLAEIEQEAAA